MENLIKEVVLNLTIACGTIYILVLISMLIANVVKKRILKHRGTIYIAIQMLLDSDDTINKNKITNMELEEMDSKVELIINENYITSNLSSRILKSELNYINKYYIIALKENLFEERKKQFNH